MVALEKFNKFLVHSESGLLSYSIDLLTRVALGQAPPQALEATQEKIAGQDGHVLLFRAGRIGDRTLSERNRFRPHPCHLLTKESSYLRSKEFPANQSTRARGVQSH
jgi:hypothetical protein